MNRPWLRILYPLALAGLLSAACTGTAAPTASTGDSHPSHADVTVANKYGLQPLAATMNGAVKEFTLTAKAIKWEVIPGEMVDAYAYNEQVPGPLLRVKEGDQIRIILKNELPEPTVIHFHGPTIPNNMDGVPDVTQPLVMPGESFTYEFTAKPAGSFVYHTHHNSAIQEAKGLYGVLIIDPANEEKPDYDVEALQVVSELGGFYVINGKSFPTTQTINAKVGERVRIRLMNLGQFIHPMHLHGYHFTVVATDGYTLQPSARYEKDTISIGPGERYDIDFVADNPGTWIFHCHILTHVQNRGVEPGGMITVLSVT